MKPTHWWNPKYPTMPNQLTAPHEGGAWEAAYSADQLREAQATALREAADRLAPNGGWRAVELNRMASELEKADAIRGLA